MIRPSDVRIGNWFLYEPDSKYCTVTAIGEMVKMQGALANFSCTYLDLIPVKVTREILTLFGFKLTDSEYQIEYDLLRNLSLRFNYRNLAELWFEGECIGCTPYIHILQNCYFDVTNILLVGNLYGSQI
jgi:hypothetical protein